MTEKVKSKKSKGTLPRKEADINTIATDVAVSWEQRPQFTLLWTDAARMKESVATFGTSYAGRKDVKGSRRSVTKDLGEVNREINKSIEFVKGYVRELHSTKNAPTHYESFGIVKEGTTYKLPSDNDKRLYALDQMLKGIAQYNLGDRKYGETYWTEIRERFARIKAQASESDKTSAEHVGIKSEQKAVIRKTLNALVHLIKANYPDTWKEELRIWGFQKEKY